MKKALIALMAVALVFAFTMPAAAQSEWNWYGSVRMDTFSNHHKPDSFGAAPHHSWRTTSWTMDPGTRLGARISAGNISGNVEWRYRATNDFGFGADSGLRHMTASWHYSDNGRLTIGQTWAPTSNFGFMGANLIPMGGAGYYAAGWRVPQITMTHSWGATTLVFGLVRPVQAANSTGNLQAYAGAVNTNRDRYFDGVRPGVNTLNEGRMQAAAGLPTLAGEFRTQRNTSTFPKFSAKLGHNFGPVNAEIFGEWVRTKVRGNIFDGNMNLQEIGVNVTGWQLGTFISFAQGPFYARGSYHFGRNPGAVEDTALLGPFWQANDPAVADGAGTLHSVKNWGWMLVAGFRVNPMFRIEAAYGQERQKVGAAARLRTAAPHPVSDNVVPFDIKERQYRWYISAPITVTQGFTITPEIIHNKRKGSFSSPYLNFSPNRGSFTVYGLYWNISF